MATIYQEKLGRVASRTVLLLCLTTKGNDNNNNNDDDNDDDDELKDESCPLEPPTDYETGR